MFQVVALYHFTRFEDPQALHGALLSICKESGIKGTILLAGEGINGTIAGAAEALSAVIQYIQSLPGCASMAVKYSHAETMPFYRMKVLIKKEIVTMGVEGIDPTLIVGTYVAPDAWNALISNPDTVIIDTRNDYEVGIGTFKGAIDPKTTSFRDFPDWFRANRDDVMTGKKKVAMFCTGGIRCEKSTAFLKAEGVEEVYHLEGGILKYLENVPREASLWEGECFVFDQRVSVGHGLELGTYGRCHACRDPLSPEEMESSLYEEGVSCPHCHADRDDGRRARYAERQKQMLLAKKRGKGHVGVNPREG